MKYQQKHIQRKSGMNEVGCIVSVFCLWICAVAQRVEDYTAFYKSLISMVVVLILCLLVKIVGESSNES